MGFRNSQIEPTPGANSYFNQPEGPYYKTHMCADYVRTGFCQFGLACHFAHRLEELINLDFSQCDHLLNDKYKS